MIKYLLLTLTTLIATQAFAANEQLRDKGEYVSRTSDCAACHTAPGANPLLAD